MFKPTDLPMISIQNHQGPTKVPSIIILSLKFITLSRYKVWDNMKLIMYYNILNFNNIILYFFLTIANRTPQVTYCDITIQYWKYKAINNNNVLEIITFNLELDYK